MFFSPLKFYLMLFSCFNAINFDQWRLSWVVFAEYHRTCITGKDLVFLKPLRSHIIEYLVGKLSPKDIKYNVGQP